ncbi:TetR/AcrR family transcriptional regulator [Candidatus Mycolicibacterium alkanivorans]|uniref:TetR/AcrR family transcriptional regulator n=1 Tax=Candidatus Mycolicibacterium alkanivorans TaxID=2954114 RepID=A0ABS9YS65_9MYCO|nr:TetR/AcrR family transcriptional regulator [Candidatus Mycolicibacterium alkanivorans]MCI4674069.1 TetR/AcrR family transcriptional regulator [Candidatus Mycolicibacterium alkanivorans]
MTTTRQQMIDTGVRLFQRGGYYATTWRGLVEEAGAPWGSINHHFPGGKQELAIEAIRVGAAAVDALIEHCFSANQDPADAVANWFALSADLMVATDYTTGCPVATVALEMVATPGPVRDETTHAFDRWQATLARQFATADRADADALATAVLALLEGALLLARARQDREPLTIAGTQARRLIDTH